MVFSLDRSTSGSSLRVANPSSADKIRLAPMSDYDQGCNEKYQQAMRAYFLGDSIFEQANTAFQTALDGVYNGLTYDPANTTL